MLGSTAIRAVYGSAFYGREAVLEKNPPWQGEGNMIADVTFERTLFNPPP